MSILKVGKSIVSIVYSPVSIVIVTVDSVPVWVKSVHHLPDLTTLRLVVARLRQHRILSAADGIDVRA